MWVVAVLGGAPRDIHKGGFASSESPDGSLIAFSSTIFNSDIWLMGPDGEDPREVATVDQGRFLGGVVWSPDSRRIAYEVIRSEVEGVRFDIESRDLKGGRPVVVLSDPKLAYAPGLWWLPDGRIIYSYGETAGSTETNLWEIKVDTGSGQPAGRPRRITSHC